MLFDGISMRNMRQQNMDSLFVGETVVDGKHLCLAVVCDGVGSTKKGAIASAFAVKVLRTWMLNLVDTDRLGLRLRDEIIRINNDLVSMAGQDGLSMASTVSALLLAGDRYYIAHAGDSRIYQVKEQAVKLLTVDQNNDGKLSQYLGKASDLEVFYNEGSGSRSRFLLCTDGLYKKTKIEFLMEAVKNAPKRNLRKALETMAMHAIEQGEQDNISLVLVICEDER